jgi:hypothetical protein
MLVPDFIKWAKEIQIKENEIMLLKGQEYTVSDEDKFKNFKSIGERTNVSALKVAMIYFLKHVDSIRNYEQHGTEASDEEIEGRIMDARNYLLLMGGIIHEEKMEKKKRLMGDFDKVVETFDGEILR